MNDDPIEPKTESSTDDESLATPLPADETVLCRSDDDVVPTSVGQPPSDGEFAATDVGAVRPTPAGGDAAAVTFSTRCLPTVVTSIGEKSWGSHICTTTLNTEIVVHGSHKDQEVDNSTSGDTIIDSDIEIKPPTEIKENADENINLECDYIFCVAAVSRTAPNSLKLLAISKIDTNIKVDIKSDGSSLNGYAADHSSSSTNSTICGQIEDQFLVPKVPRDSISFSSSSSSNGVLLQHLKSKTNNILLSKNVYTYPENLICHHCNCVYPGVSENFNMDCKEYIKKSQIKSRVKRSKQKKKSKQSHLNNNCNLKRTSKKTKQNTESIFDEKTEVKIEKEDELQNIEDVAVAPVENQINEPISFEKGNKVFAYWVADKLFYPAIIVDIVYPKYKVEFLSDFVVKTVNADCLVHSSAVKKGSLIAIFDTISQEYRVGEIVSINEVPNSEDTYTIDLNSEEVVVSFDKLILDEDKARTLQKKTVIRNYNRLSLSNISDGKRLRSSRSTSIKCTNSNLTKSSKRKIVKEDAPQLKKKQKCLFPEERDPRDIPSTSTGITGGNYDFLPLPSSDDSDFDRLREELNAVNMRQLRNTDIDSEHSTPDKCNHRVVKTPPNKSTKVFKDLHVVLSYAKYKRIPMCNDSDQSTDNELSLKTDFFIPDKLHKKYIETLIGKHGGTCHRYLNSIPRSRYKFTYLISDTPSQTCNFLLCLGLGIPCYHHKHVEDAIYQKTPFAEYLANNKIKPIPNGWAVETREIIFRSPKTAHTCLFSGYIIYLSLATSNKNAFFAGLLRFCGAVVYTSWSNGVVMPLTRHITVIVTDEKCPNILVSAQVPKLSIFWVVQSLICESVRPIDGHESYVAIDNSVDGIDDDYDDIADNQ